MHERRRLLPVLV